MVNRTYSLNLITYLRTKGFRVDVKTDNGYKFYGEYESSSQVEEAIATYKADKELHAYLEQFKILRENINTMRASIK